MFDTESCEEAANRLEASGLFMEHEIKIARNWAYEVRINPWVYGAATVTGWSPNKAGEILGVSGKGLQGKCRAGKIEATQNYEGWWTIPAGEIIRLREEQNAKAKK